MMAKPLPKVVLPGEILASASDYVPGPGTHIYNSQLCASISGLLNTSHSPQAPSSTDSNVRPKAHKPLSSLSVTRPTPANAAAFTNATTITTVLPEVNAVVLARVTRITTLQATVSILVVGDSCCGEGDEFQGVIRYVGGVGAGGEGEAVGRGCARAWLIENRVQDVRATEKDKVKMFESFRPGDIVRAQVVSSS